MYLLFFAFCAIYKIKLFLDNTKKIAHFYKKKQAI